MTNDIHEFKPLLVEIEDRPLNPLGRTILYLVLSFIILSILWLFLSKIDIVVSARGKVIPSGEIKILKPLESGVISKIFVKDGDMVKKGDILMQIDPSVTDSTLSSKQESIKILTSDITLLNALINDKNLTIQEISTLNNTQKELYLSQLEFINSITLRNNAKIQSANIKINSTKKEINRLNILLDDEIKKENRLKNIIDLIPRKEYNQVSLNIKNIKEQIDIAEFELLIAKKELEITKQESINELKNIKSNLSQNLLLKQKEQIELKAQIETILFSNKAQKIISPVDGYVGKLLTHTQGGVVNINDHLISIVPNDVPLIIKAQVLNKDIGFLKLGQEVSIKIDTFDFQKYGLLNAVVTHIANDAIEDEKLGLIYEIYISPKKLSLLVDGKSKNIETGMSVTAEIKVGKRKIIELFIYPIIKYIDEGLSVR